MAADPARLQTPHDDLEACAREPIHVPGSIQPHGALLVLGQPDLTIIQVAAPREGALRTLGEAIGSSLRTALPAWAGSVADQLAAGIAAEGNVYLGCVKSEEGESYHAVAHRSGDELILELEAAEAGDPGSFEDIYPLVRSFLASLQSTRSVEQLGELAAREVRRITGLDRVLVYRFDADWNGTVIAEDRNEILPSYLDLRFPASDIPAQARELYRLNRLRLIADAYYEPIPIQPALNPRTARPVDLSHAMLRSVSPVHLEYMRNMGTGASMSISLLRDGQLWGLISCHNQAPYRVPYHVRTACDFIGHIVSLQIAAREQAELADRRIALRSVQARLLARMAAEENYVDGLAAAPEDLLGLTHAAGVAIVAGDVCRLIGETPPELGVKRIVDWLAEREPEDIVATDSLVSIMAGAEGLKDKASGLLAVPISQIHASYVLWFRPEVVRTVAWGGEPTKAVDPTPAAARISPRKSFEVWKETVRNRAVAWDEAELDAASQLRSAIVDIVLRQAEEKAELNEQLMRSNRELEAFSYSVSHDLRAPFRHIVGYAQLLKQYEGERLSERGDRYVETIIESAVSAGTLVDSLLSFSQMGRATLHPMTIDMNRLVAEVRQRAEMDVRDRTIEWHVAELAPAYADSGMLRLVVQNLLENAIKFTRGRECARIDVDCSQTDTETIYSVRDNGVGFDMAYVGKLFGVFQRLHRVEEFEGTGIGLANVKRIVEDRHGGRVWAVARPDQGATFHVALPRLAGAA